MFKPTCRKCGENHYNFLRCAEAVEVEAAQEAKREMEIVRPLWRTPDGAHEWGDRLHTYEPGPVLWRRRED